MFKVDLKKAKQTMKVIFQKPLYISISIAVALFVFVFNIIIPNINIVFIEFMNNGLLGALKIIFEMSISVSNFMVIPSIISLGLLSILTGLSISIAVFKMKHLKTFNLNKDGSVSIGGFILGVLVPGCSSCGIGVLASMGLSAGLATLPLAGLEISILSVLIMIWLVAWLATNARNAPNCKIKKNRSKF